MSEGISKDYVISMIVPLKPSKPHWWEGAVFYQIYIRSFQDSNDDGIGDLRGIISRLDYLQSLGIEALWITPFYPSPQVDFGYDIMDYFDIDPQFGTMADFEQLIQEAEKRQINIIIDLVLNHTSDQHPFFIESRSGKDSAKRDWYIWRDPTENGKPPNNWAGFEQSSWTFDDLSGQYYYHFFSRQQPDLNWRNQEVKEVMFKVLDFWLELGVKGFRLDTINFLLEDEAFRDNPVTDEVPFYLKQVLSIKQLPVYTINHPENHQIIKALRQHLKNQEDSEPVLIGEIFVPTVSDLVPYYGEQGDEIQLPFNFFLSNVDKLSAVLFRQVLADDCEYLSHYPTTTVLSNHDLLRATTRHASSENSDAVAKLLATMLLTLRGAPFIYYGSEIGMRDCPPENIDEVQDPIGKLDWPEYKGRDGGRTPMQWDNSKNAGFTKVKPWLKLNPDYVQRNVKAQLANPHSILNYYKKLIALRKSSSSLRRGKLTLFGEAPSVLAYLREEQNESILVLLNMSQENSIFRGENFELSHQKIWKVVTSTHSVDTKHFHSLRVNLQPFEGMVLRLQN
ncbi:MAG: alpha-glucosidase [Xenococcaceae cyanobacterium MO_167.B27]|nr:alpha-glucosidase [Xenococcaceae cyanobacterium MO_167.B27]